ncbi:hypothetical protein ACPCHQ_21850 [Ralstonia thomasii]|uniref:hypothetical protein n=1 Tax=Ralstonia thomasii TaxID=3058596 RepID=UPI003C2D10DE
MKNLIHLRFLSGLAAAVLATAFSFLFGVQHGWFGAVFTLVLAGLFGSCFIHLLNRYDRSLAKRIATDAPIAWDVRLNGIRIGNVSDAEYAAMQRHVLHDPRNAVAQLCNLGRMASIALDKLIALLPLLFFWGVVTLAVFAPDSCTEAIRELQRADAAAITAAVRTALHVGVSCSVMAVALMVAMGFRFGYRNRYSDAVGRMVRLHCGASAEGDIQVWRLDLAGVAVHG